MRTVQHARELNLERCSSDPLLVVLFLSHPSFYLKPEISSTRYKAFHSTDTAEKNHQVWQRITECGLNEEVVRCKSPIGTLQATSSWSSGSFAGCSKLPWHCPCWVQNPGFTLRLHASMAVYNGTFSCVYAEIAQQALIGRARVV